jgi:hypothetical protein
MKSILACLLILVSQEALADTHSYSSDAIEILGIAAQCPTEFGQAAALGRVVGAAHDSDVNSDSYRIAFATGGLLPDEVPFPVAVLEITRTFVPSTVVAPDAPGGAYHYTCYLGHLR